VDLGKVDRVGVSEQVGCFGGFLVPDVADPF